MILPCCTPGVCSLGFWHVMGIEVLDLQLYCLFAEQIKHKECCFPQGDKFMCPFHVVVVITFFLTSSWGPPLQANLKDLC